MDKTPSIRQQRIYEIAKKDLAYQVWRDSFEQFHDAFAQFAGEQPDDI